MITSGTSDIRALLAKTGRYNDFLENNLLVGIEMYV